MNEKLKCQICEGYDISFLFEKSNFNYYRCNKCEIIFTHPLPNEKQIEEYYSRNYSAGYIEKKKYKTDLAKKQVKSFSSFIKPGNLLEIGASAGFVLNEAQKNGWNVFGTEYSDDGIEYCKNEFGIVLYKGDVKKAEFKECFFDLVVAYDVIEHVSDLNEFVSEIYRITKPDGIVEIVTPNAGHILARIQKSRWRAYKPIEHIFYFNQKSITHLFNKHNFSLYNGNKNFLRDILSIRFIKNCSRNKKFNKVKQLGKY